jgi:hypothetical protein
MSRLQELTEASVKAEHELKAGAMASSELDILRSQVTPRITKAIGHHPLFIISPGPEIPT